MKPVSPHSRLAQSLIAAVVAASAFALPACNSGNNNTPPLTGAFRIANGVSDSDASGMGARLNNAAVFNNILKNTASGINNPPIGSYPALIDTNGANFTVDNVPINHNSVSTVFTYGTAAGGTANGFTATEPLAAPDSTHFVVQVVHDAFDANALGAGTLSFYFVTPPGTDLTGTTPLTAAFRASPNPVTLPAGTYRIIVTNGVTTQYDSGPAGITLPPSGTNVLQVAALDAPGAPAGSPLSLLILDNGGGFTAVPDGAP